MTLQETSKNFRKAIKIFVLVVVLYYIATGVIAPAAMNFYERLNPPKDPATPIYGFLDPLEFTEKKIVGTPSIILNTKNGRLPTGGPIKMTVYKFKLPRFSYEAGKTARSEAAIFGFTDADLTSDLKGETYSWRSNSIGSTMEMSITNRNFTISTSLSGKTTSFTPGVVNAASVNDRVREVTQKLGRFTDPLYNDGYKVVKFGKFAGTDIIETKLQQEAQLAMVDVYRAINKYPVLGPNPNVGMLHMVMGPVNSAIPLLNYPIVNATYWEIETQSNATYPIITPTDAWTAVVAGKGVVASVMPKTQNVFQTYNPVRVNKILINNIYLAYYETVKFQKFLQPIYVFEGVYTDETQKEGGSIVLYFPAVDGQYIKPAPKTPSTSTVTQPLAQ